MDTKKISLLRYPTNELSTPISFGTSYSTKDRIFNIFLKASVIGIDERWKLSPFTFDVAICLVLDSSLLPWSSGVSKSVPCLIGVLITVCVCVCVFAFAFVMTCIGFWSTSNAYFSLFVWSCWTTIGVDTIFGNLFTNFSSNKLALLTFMLWLELLSAISIQNVWFGNESN